MRMALTLLPMQGYGCGSAALCSCVGFPAVKATPEELEDSVAVTSHAASNGGQASKRTILMDHASAGSSKLQANPENCTARTISSGKRAQEPCTTKSTSMAANPGPATESLTGGTQPFSRILVDVIWVVDCQAA